MIESLKGELLAKGADHVVVECHGVGYLVHVAASTLSRLPEAGVFRLHVHYAVSVDVRSGQSEHKLIGFIDPAERKLFRRLIEVQGVSATLGLAIMGAMPTDALHAAIMSGDVKTLTAVKGIGPKLAQRIVAELGGKLGHDDAPLAHGVGDAGNTLRSEALLALVSLGLDRNKADRALSTILQQRKGDPPALEELIRLTLKDL